MQPDIFEAIDQQERTYWWFVGRRRLVRDWFIRHHAAGSGLSRRMLDIGCGTGAMLEEWMAQGPAVGTDLSPVALRFCRKRGLRRVLLADATHLPFAEGTFAGISAMDVLEHIADDAAAMRECHRVCAPGGMMLITVPALRWLWSTRDERLAHQRRYHRAELMTVARQAGFTLVKCSYSSLSLFFPFAAIVLLNRLMSRTPDFRQDVPRLSGKANRILLALLLAEQWLLRWVNYPFGVSLFCVLQKPLSAVSP